MPVAQGQMLCVVVCEMAVCMITDALRNSSAPFRARGVYSVSIHIASLHPPLERSIPKFGMLHLSHNFEPPPSARALCVSYI